MNEFIPAAKNLNHVSINEKQNLQNISHQRLQKRLLRAKISSILKSIYSQRCAKHRQTFNQQSANEEKGKYIYEKEYEEKIKDPKFIKKPLKLGPYDPEEYVPGSKFQKLLHSKSLPKVQMTLEDVKNEIKKRLTKEELLEVFNKLRQDFIQIGEDPAYFIQNEQLRDLDWIDWEERQIQRHQIVKVSDNLIKPLKKSFDLQEIENKYQKRQEVFSSNLFGSISNFQSFSNLDRNISHQKINRGQQSFQRISKKKLKESPQYRVSLISDIERKYSRQTRELMHWRVQRKNERNSTNNQDQIVQIRLKPIGMILKSIIYIER